MTGMDKVRKVLVYIRENEPVTANALKRKFDKETMNTFERYTTYGEPYIMPVLGKRIELYLTKEGIEKSYELERLAEDSRRDDVIAFATIILAVFALLHNSTTLEKSN